jgi:hypothetical protein
MWGLRGNRACRDYKGAKEIWEFRVNPARKVIRDLPGIAGATIQVESSASDFNQAKTVTATCPLPNQIVVGGGYKTNYSNNPEITLVLS